MNQHSTTSATIPESFQEAIAVFERHHGILKSGDAQALGVDTRTIADMHAAGLLDRLSRGVYRLAHLPPLDYPDLVVVALRAPKAVVCLISALAFHEMTTEIPRKVHIALPKSVRAPRLKYPPLDVIWLSSGSYETGIETHELNGVPVQIYTPEKTVADCFKFRNKIGKDIAIAALQDYMRRNNVNIERLLRMARINRVENIVRPYMEALT